jgi:hypothetical protein
MPAPRTNPVFRARIEKGAVRWFGIEGKRFDALRRKFEGKDVEIVLRLPQKKTTDPQRRYYFGVIVAMICEEAGYGPEHKEAIHEFLKGMFLKDTSGQLPITRSTQSLTTVEREEYHSNCRRWAAEFFGLYIPLPNEVDMEQITA